MGSRRCCCGTVDVPCSDQCCEQCMWGDTITETSGIPIGRLDEVILYQGCVTNNLDEVGNPKVKISYPKVGAYWVWFPPPFSANYDIGFPSCTTLTPLTDEGRCWNYPGDNPRELCYRQLPKADDTTIRNYYCGANYPPQFSNVSTNEPYNTSFSNPAYGWFGGVFLANELNSTNVVYGYPCSSEYEDNCCRDNATLPERPDNPNESNGSWNTTNGIPGGHCNKYGLTAYRRRIIENYYPWIWQIFSYNEDQLINFGDGVLYFDAVIDNGKLVSEDNPKNYPDGIGYQVGQFYYTSLRHQFLGYAHCQHHFDRENGCTELQGEPSGFPLGKYIPRQFIYSCSGIPMFEFDFAEAERENIEFEENKRQLIRKMRDFTVFFKSASQPEVGATTTFPTPGYPSEGAINSVRTAMNTMARDKYTGFITKDWRKEALLELFEAENIYREYSGNPNFDLFVVMGKTRPVDITTDEGISNAIASIFPQPLGAVRKRCRSVELGENLYINVLIPKNLIDDGWLVTDDAEALQSLNFADISVPLRNLSQYGLPTAQSNLIAYTDLYAKISSLCYTYFRMMPGGWDWCSFGALPNGSEPQNNWWFRKMGILSTAVEDVPFFQTVPGHSQLNNCAGENLGNKFEFAWNPTGQGILEGDDPVPDFEDPDGGLDPGSICDAVCGRSTYTSYPDVLLGFHSVPYTKRNCSSISHCPNQCINTSNQYASFVRYSKKQYKWDSSKFPFRSKLMTEEERTEYLTSDISASISVTNTPCANCFPCENCVECEQGTCGEGLPGGEFSIKALNGDCSLYPNAVGDTSPCQAIGIRKELRLNIEYQPDADNPNDTGVNASGGELSLGPVSITECNSSGTIFGCPAAGPAITEKVNCLQENPPCAGTFPSCRYYDPADPTITMFDSQCCELISNCDDCNTVMEENCWQTASRWCNSPKYGGYILAFSTDYPGQHYPCSNEPFGAGGQGVGGDETYNNATDYGLYNFNSFPGDEDFRSTVYLCNDNPFGGYTGNGYTPSNQRSCAGLISDISEDYLTGIGMPTNMVSRYKGSFCFCNPGSTGSASGTITQNSFEYSLTNPNTPDSVVCEQLAFRLCAGVDVLKYDCAYRKIQGSFPCNIIMNSSTNTPCTGDDMVYYRSQCYQRSTLETTKIQCDSVGGIWSASDGTGVPCWTQEVLGKIIDGCYKAI